MKVYEGKPGHLFTVKFEEERNSAEADITLLREAANWLEQHPDNCLVSIDLSSLLEAQVDTTTLTLFMEEGA